MLPVLKLDCDIVNPFSALSGIKYATTESIQYWFQHNGVCDRFRLGEKYYCLLSMWSIKRRQPLWRMFHLKCQFANNKCKVR